MLDIHAEAASYNGVAGEDDEADETRTVSARGCTSTWKADHGRLHTRASGTATPSSASASPPLELAQNVRIAVDRSQALRAERLDAVGVHLVVLDDACTDVRTLHADARVHAPQSV